MKRQFPGLHFESKDGSGLLEGVFLVRVDRAFYRFHPEKPFFALRFAILEPREHTGQTISGRLYCSKKALWRLNWFCVISATIPICWVAMKSRSGLFSAWSVF